MTRRFSTRAAICALLLSACINAGALTLAHAHSYAGPALDASFALLMLCNLPALPLIAAVPWFTGTPEPGVSAHPMYPAILWTLAIAGPPLNAGVAAFVWPALKRF